MKDGLGYMIDIERFVKWTFHCDHLFYDDEIEHDELFSKKARSSWRAYTKFPLKKTINEVNDHLEGEMPFEIIDIAELIICINNAKDHSRGKINPDQLPITSTGKKVMNILLLGGEMDCFVCSDSEYSDLYQYLKKEKACAGTKIGYAPGRTVSAKQIDKALSKYRNKISYNGIIGGLEQLTKIGLVETIDKERVFYKLSFMGCKKFVNNSLI